MNKNRILNWGWYGYYNLGDDLLQNVMIDLFKSNEIEPIFTMRNEYTSIDSEQVPRSYLNLYRRAKDCDALVIGPGGLFPFSNYPKLLAIYGAVKWWRFRKKKVIFFGVGISSNLDGKNRRLWRKIIDVSTLFYTRSPGFLKAVGKPESDTVKTIPDIVFSSKHFEKSGMDLHSSTKTIAISVANLNNGQNEEGYMETVRVWSEVCEKLISDGYSIDLLSFTKDSDERMSEAIIDSVKSLDKQNRIHHISYAELNKSLEKWKSYSAVICTRFHSVVISILAGVPPIPIAYGQKTVNLARNCGLDDYLIYWNPFEAGYLGKLYHTDSNTIIMTVQNILAKEQKVRKSLTEFLSEKKTELLSATTSFSQSLKKVED